MQLGEVLNEGARVGDLEYLVSKKIHIDEFDSKLGPADDVVTISFKVRQRSPAEDLVSYLENGYDWVLDADVSTGEIIDGEYLVFVEVPRRGNLWPRLEELLEDLQHLTGIKPQDWKFKWWRDETYHPMEKDLFNKIVPTKPATYKAAVEARLGPEDGEGDDD